jgi:hypothetical protein
MLEFAPRAYTLVEYDQAWLYAVTCTHHNYYDWRLPTYKEYNRSKLIRTWYEDRPDDKLPDRHVTPVRTNDRTSP